MGQRPPSVEEGRRWLGTENLSLSYLMLVVTEAVLFRVFGSVSLPLTVAVLVILFPFRAAGAFTTIVTVALAPLARLPIEQVTFPEALVQPDEAETKVTPAGRESVAVTPVAGLGPLFFTVTV